MLLDSNSACASNGAHLLSIFVTFFTLSAFPSRGNLHGKFKCL